MLVIKKVIVIICFEGSIMSLTVLLECSVRLRGLMLMAEQSSTFY